MFASLLFVYLSVLFLCPVYMFVCFICMSCLYVCLLYLHVCLSFIYLHVWRFIWVYAKVILREIPQLPPITDDRTECQDWHVKIFDGSP